MLFLLVRNCNNRRLLACGKAITVRQFSAGSDHDTHQKSSIFSLARPIESLLMRSKLITDPDAARLVSKTIALSTYTLALISLLGTLGLDTSPLLTGVGITGFTVGFAVKEVATNLLSGAMLVMGKVVRKGMWVRLLVAAMPGIEGRVESVDIRNVVLKTKEGNRIIVPSVILFTNPLIILPDPVDSHHHSQSQLTSLHFSPPPEAATSICEEEQSKNDNTYSK
jgi:small-conductance mechanosensitive channel